RTRGRAGGAIPLHVRERLDLRGGGVVVGGSRHHPGHQDRNIASGRGNVHVFDLLSVGVCTLGILGRGGAGGQGGNQQCADEKGADRCHVAGWGVDQSTSNSDYSQAPLKSKGRENTEENEKKIGNR